jgi:hypothetical protein
VIGQREVQGPARVCHSREYGQCLLLLPRSTAAVTDVTGRGRLAGVLEWPR